MTLSDRAAAAAPYAQQLLSDREVQDALRRVVGATRGAYARGRGRSASQAVEDKKLRRQLQQALGAAYELWSALGAPAPRRKSRWGRNVAAVAVIGAGGFLVLNADARQRVLDLLGKNDANAANPPQ